MRDLAPSMADPAGRAQTMLERRVRESEIEVTLIVRDEDEREPYGD